MGVIVGLIIVEGTHACQMKMECVVIVVIAVSVVNVPQAELHVNQMEHALMLVILLQQLAVNQMEHV